MSSNKPELSVGLGYEIDEASAKKVESGMKKLGNQIENDAEKSSKKVGNSWGNAFSGMVKGFIAVEVAGRALGFGKDLLLLEEKFRNMQMPLKNLTEQTGDFGRSMSFLTGLADTLGQDIFTLSDAYKGIYASGKQAGMSTGELNNIFQAVIRSGSALKLSNEKIELSMKAIEQMMNKGVIGSEELRQQLGDHLPGAYALMAKAAKDAGLSVSGSTAELGKLLEDGKLASNVVLPFFAKRMEEAFGKNAEANVNTLSGATNRLNNELTYFTTALDNGRVLGFWADFKNGMATAFQDLTYYVNSGSWKEFISHFGMNGGLKGHREKMQGQEAFAKKPKSEQSTELKSLINEARNPAFLRDGGKEYQQELIEKIKTYTGIFKATKDIVEKIEKPKSPTGSSEGNSKVKKEWEDYLRLLDEAALKSRQAAIESKFLNEAIAEVFAKTARMDTSMGQAQTLDNSSVKNADKKSWFDDMLGISGVDLDASTSNLEKKLEVLRDRIKGSIVKIKDTTKDEFTLMQTMLRETMMVVGNSLGDAFAGIFESMLSKDVKFDFKNVLAGFFRAMGQMVTAMGSAILAAGLGLSASVFGMGEGAKSIAAGVGLMALGGALMGGGAAISNNSKKSPSQSQSYNGTFTAPAQGTSGNQKVEFVIQGSTLKGVLDNTQRIYG